MGKINDTIATVKTGLDVQIYLATAEEKEKLADAKLALADLKLEVAELRGENEELKSKLRVKDDFALKKGVIWNVDDEAESQPYCPACYAKGRAMPLQKTEPGVLKNKTVWICPDKSCEAEFNPFDYIEEPYRIPDGKGGTIFSMNRMP